MEYFKPFLTLLLFLLSFHCLFIYSYPQTKIFWKIVDYIWISFGVIEIIGATFSFQREQSNAREPFLKNCLTYDYNVLLDQILEKKEYYQDSLGFDYGSFQDKDEANRFIQAGKFYNSLYITTIKFKDIVLKDGRLNYIDTLKNKHEAFRYYLQSNYLKQDAKIINYFFDRLDISRKDYVMNLNDSERGRVNWILLYISPYLLSIAIALRLTKVTAELKELH